MKEQKIKIAIRCLYAAAGIQMLSTVYAMAMIFQLKQEMAKSMAQYPDLALANSFPYGSGFSIWAAVVMVGAIIVSKELKEDKPWAWIGAIVVLLMAAPSWALPAAVIGLVCLLDSRVREEYLKRLDISI